MSQVNNNSNVTGLMNNIDLGPTGSIQLQFAKLQLALAEMNKSNAMDNMKSIENSQKEQKEVAAMLQQARQLQADAKSGKTVTTMPPEMVKYMDDNKLAYDKTGSDDLHNKDEWEVNIKSLQSHLEQLGTNTQQKMVLVQDFMGQYNSYIQGANSSISQNNQVLQSLAQGR